MAKVTLASLQEKVDKLSEDNRAWQSRAWEAEAALQKKTNAERAYVDTCAQQEKLEYRGLYEGFKEATILFRRSEKAEILDIEKRFDI